VICLLLPGVAAALDYRQIPLPELRRLAAQGDAQAQVELGLVLEYGEGVARDPQAAREWYCRAAARGSADAELNLGWMFAGGRGMERNDDIASYWLGRAAAAGNQRAARLLRQLPESLATGSSGCESIATLPWLEQRCSDAACQQIVTMVEGLSGESGLEANLILSVISAESAFDPRARSPKGARGLMQLIPATAKRFGVRDIWNPEQNIRGGIAYLQWLLAYFEGDLERVLAGYNAGEHRVRQYRGIPPYAETRAYVKRILQDYGKRRHPFEKAWLEQVPPVGASVVEHAQRGSADFKG